MSTIVHQQNTNLFYPIPGSGTTISITENISTQPVNINGFSLYCVQHIWSDVSGSWQIIIEGSNVDGDKTDNDYTTIDITVMGSVPAGNRMVNVEKAGYSFVRVRVAYTSGGGTLRSILNGKVW